MPTRISCGGTVLRFLFDSSSPSCSLSTHTSPQSQEIKPIPRNTDLATGALERGHTVVNAQPWDHVAIPVALR
uniref:Uncharacterized protein n=1 Tax=Oryza glumipatula TaxID=40148 RepID=A0A0E0AZL7_9ORYZ